MLVILHTIKQFVFEVNDMKIPANYSFPKHVMFCFIAMLFLSAASYAQQMDPDKPHIKLFEITQGFYGTNDVLINGQKYIPGHFLADGHPYFPDEIWSKGSLIINRTLFDQVDLLYNSEIDKVILRTRVSSGDTIFVELNNQKVDEFTIGDHTFILLTLPGFEMPASGFYEVVYNGNFRFLIKHQKSFIPDYSKISPNGHFSKLNSTNYILKDEQLVKVINKKSFLNYFSPNDKSIKTFMKKNKINYSKANQSAMKLLLKYCDDVSSGKI